MFKIVLMLDAMGMYLLTRLQGYPNDDQHNDNIQQRHCFALLQYGKSNLPPNAEASLRLTLSARTINLLGAEPTK